MLVNQSEMHAADLQVNLLRNPLTFAVVTPIFGPSNFGGWSVRFTAIIPFARYSGVFLETVNRISLIFCMKLAYSKSKK